MLFHKVVIGKALSFSGCGTSQLNTLLLLLKEGIYTIKADYNKLSSGRQLIFLNDITRK